MMLSVLTVAGTDTFAYLVGESSSIDHSPTKYRGMFNAQISISECAQYEFNFCVCMRVHMCVYLYIRTKWRLDTSSRLATIDMGAKIRGLCPLFMGGGAGSPTPSNRVCPGPRPTCMLSFIVIRPTVWPQYTNVTDRQHRQDRTGQTGQTAVR